MTTSLDSLRATTSSSSRNITTVQIPQVYLQPGTVAGGDAFELENGSLLGALFAPQPAGTLGLWTFSVWVRNGFRIDLLDDAGTGGFSVYTAAQNTAPLVVSTVDEVPTVTLTGTGLIYGYNNVVVQSNAGALTLYLNGIEVDTGNIATAFGPLTQFKVSNNGISDCKIRNLAVWSSYLDPVAVFTINALGPRHDLRRLHSSHATQPHWYWRGDQNETSHFLNVGSNAITNNLVASGNAMWGLDDSDDLISARIVAAYERMIPYPIAITGIETYITTNLPTPGRILYAFYTAVTAPTSAGEIRLSIVDSNGNVFNERNINGSTSQLLFLAGWGIYSGTVRIRLQAPEGDVVNGLAMTLLIHYIPTYIETPVV